MRIVFPVTFTFDIFKLIELTLAVPVDVMFPIFTTFEKRRRDSYAI